MPLPLRSPKHSRNPSESVDAAYEDDSVASSPQNRRQSRSSLHDLTTPIRTSFQNHDGLDMNVFSSGGIGAASGGGMGLGNLADELADAFSDSGDSDSGDSGAEDYENESPNISITAHDNDAHAGIEGTRDSGVDVASPAGAPEAGRPKSMSLSLPHNGRAHRRAGSEYDGSEYGSDSDLDSPGMPPSLVAKIDAVESLARRGTESNGGPTDGVFKRVTENLKDLGSQSGVESSATRLITAHSALTTHLTHQTRQLHNLAFPLLSPLVAPPDPETIDALLPMLLALPENMPRPSTTAYNSLTALHSLTSDLVQTLNYLSDTLHMSRQTTTTATRRLKSAKEVVAELRREEELREEGERWLTRGNWGERLRKRECASVCGEVVGGFEKVCDDWRARLVAQAESAQA